MTAFMHLNDSGNERELLVRAEHVAAAEVLRKDRIVVLHLLSGETLPLTQEESRQFLQHAHPVPQEPTPTPRPAKRRGAGAG